jgi:hypothetical protein
LEPRLLAASWPRCTQIFAIEHLKNVRPTLFNALLAVVAVVKGSDLDMIETAFTLL